MRPATQTIATGKGLQRRRAARDWLAAWTERDIRRTLWYNSDEVTFHSPRIAKVIGKDIKGVFGKQALRDYWTNALSLVPQIFFELSTILFSFDTKTIPQTNRREKLQAETFTFDPDGRVARAPVSCH